MEDEWNLGKPDFMVGSVVGTVAAKVLKQDRWAKYLPGALCSEFAMCSEFLKICHWKERQELVWKKALYAS